MSTDGESQNSERSEDEDLIESFDRFAITSTYWERHDFEPHEGEDPVESFNRLANLRGWAPRSRRYRREYAECIGLAFEERFGSDESRLAGWQDLCRAAGIDDIPNSIRQCKLALKQVHINIVDLIQARATGKPVKKFKSKRALRDYIIESKKIFPKRAAKHNGFLKALLITVFS